MKGVTVCIEALGFALFEMGDVVITPTPTYARFFADLEERAGVELIGLPLSEEDDFLLTSQKLEDKILELRKEGKSVQGFLFCNPSNPLGEIYPLELAEQLMKVCAKYQMHFLADEVYALSNYDTKIRFKSVLSLGKNVPDPLRTHFMWGLSKDLGIAGFRFGVVHTQNKDVIKVLNGMAIYTGLPPHIQELGAKMLKDKSWLEEIYFPRNISRLQNNYNRFKAFLESKHGLKVRKASAGFFIWVNFARFMEKKTLEDEMLLFGRLLDKFKLYIIPGSKMSCIDPGWFRIVIAIKPSQVEVFEKRFDAFALTFAS